MKSKSSLLRDVLVIALFGMIIPCIVALSKVNRVTDISDLTQRAMAHCVKVTALDSFGNLKGFGAGFSRSENQVFTNAHVIENAQRFSVTLSNGEVHEAKLVGADYERDVAIIEIDDAVLKPTPIANLERVSTGDRVIAIGTPWGFQHSVSAGVVSSLNREVNGKSFIQTDASINPGNSGGALFALVDGQPMVIGMNTWISTSVGESNGVGFAIPAPVFAEIGKKLAKD